MSKDIHLKEKYSLAKCCSPTPPDEIVGYFSYDDNIRVHHHECQNLMKVEPERRIPLEWSEIIEESLTKPGVDYDQLDDIDFSIMKHHADLGIDYSLMVAKVLKLSKQEAFDRHKKLKGMKLLERVDATMVQYRKNIVDHKWIKHRNHTYYQLANKGKAYLAYFQSQNE